MRHAEFFLEDLLDRFRHHLAAEGKSPHTMRAYTRDVRLFGEWFQETNAGAMTPERITPIDLREYRSYLLTVKGYKPATVNRKLASLSSFCQWAREVGRIPANPVQGISQVEEVRPAPKWLDKKGQYALLRAVQERGKVRDVALITLMLNTGLRVSEVSNLVVGDLEISPRKGMLVVRGGKGNKYRRVPLNADARKAVDAYLAECGEVSEEDPLFDAQRSGALQPPGIYYLIKRYAYDARLEDVTPHTLRHTFGKNLVDAGVSLDRVAQGNRILGFFSHHESKTGPLVGSFSHRCHLHGRLYPLGRQEWRIRDCPVGWLSSWGMKVWIRPASTPRRASRTCKGRWRRWPSGRYWGLRKSLGQTGK